MACAPCLFSRRWRWWRITVDAWRTPPVSGNALSPEGSEGRGYAPLSAPDCCLSSNNIYLDILCCFFMFSILFFVFSVAPHCCCCGTPRVKASAMHQHQAGLCFAGRLRPFFAFFCFSLFQSLVRTCAAEAGWGECFFFFFGFFFFFCFSFFSFFFFFFFF